MSEEQRRTPLDTISAFESLAFRASQTARMLLAEHPDLPVQTIQPHAFAYQRPDSDSAVLEIHPPDTDGVRAWADALGAQVDVTFYDTDAATGAFESHLATVTGSDGVSFRVTATRTPDEDEIARWRAKRAQDATQSGGGL